MNKTSQWSLRTVWQQATYTHTHTRVITQSADHTANANAVTFFSSRRKTHGHFTSTHPNESLLNTVQLFISHKASNARLTFFPKSKICQGTWPLLIQTHLKFALFALSRILPNNKKMWKTEYCNKVFKLSILLKQHWLFKIADTKSVNSM